MLIIGIINTEKVNNKIRSRSGESISETLVALLIAALALTVLAGAVSASSGIIERSRTRMKDHYLADNYLSTLGSDGLTAENVESGDSIVTVNMGTSATAPFFNEDVVIYKNLSFEGSREIIAYKLKND